MKQPTVFGRKLPRQDFEGDDRMPGGKYVTCQDTAAGRMVAWATNGRIDKDGRIYRAVLNDPDGIRLDQAAVAIKRVARLDLVQPRGWKLANVKTHLRYGRGLIVNGDYGAIPRAYRHQAFAHFDHAMWVSHLSAASGNVRLWDPLNPDIHAYGRWVPASVIWAFLETLDFACAYVALEPL
jgi:hypothetical protein